MTTSMIETELLTTLATNYERDPFGYITLPKNTVDSADARVAIADMRNQGYVDEQVRGVVRLTARGYKACRNRLLISA
jgi:hypothetical protein